MPISSFQEQVSLPDPKRNAVAYYYNKWRTSFSFVASLVFALFFFFCMFVPTPNPRLQFGLGVTLGILMLGISIARFYQAMTKKPAFVVSPKGVCIEAYAAEWIDWSNVASLTRSHYRRRDFLKLKFVPEVATSLRRPFVSKLFGWLIGARRNGVTVNLRLLTANPDEVVRQCDYFFSLARREAMIASGVSPSPPPLPPAFVQGRIWFTYSLIALLAVIYAAELRFAVNANRFDAPSIFTLALSGAASANLVLRAGDWWRLFTAPMLHANLVHLLSNGLVLLIAGRALEKFLGWRWMSCIFAGSALAGSLGSIFFHAPNVVTVGASGGIMGLLGALIVVSFRLEKGNYERTQLQIFAARTAIPALLPFLAGRGGLAIDFAAHGFGAAAGILIAFLIRGLWPRMRPEPRFSWVAAGVAFGFFLVVAGSLIPIMHEREVYAPRLERQ